MILYDGRGHKYNFVKAQRRFQHYGVNGKRYQFWYEVGRGTWLYFRADDGWRKCRMWFMPGGVGELFTTHALYRECPAVDASAATGDKP